jgi:hypothetical protein
MRTGSERQDVHDLPQLRANARKAEEAFLAALTRHYGRDAAGYARFFAPSDMPSHISRLAAAQRAATDRLMRALRSSPDGGP